MLGVVGHDHVAPLRGEQDAKVQRVDAPKLVDADRSQLQQQQRLPQLNPRR